MNLELLEKLVRLANNNPNENEANLAARRVCKMLWNDEKNRLRIQNPKIEQPLRGKSPEPWTYQPSQSQEDFLRDLFVKKDKYYKEYRYGDWDEWGESKRKKEEKPKRGLKCTKCGEIINTAFVGSPQIYVCNVCIWKDYSESKT